LARKRRPFGPKNPRQPIIAQRIPDAPPSPGIQIGNVLLSRVYVDDISISTPVGQTIARQTAEPPFNESSLTTPTTNTSPASTSTEIPLALAPHDFTPCSRPLRLMTSRPSRLITPRPSRLMTPRPSRLHLGPGHSTSDHNAAPRCPDTPTTNTSPASTNTEIPLALVPHDFTALAPHDFTALAPRDSTALAPHDPTALAPSPRARSLDLRPQRGPGPRCPVMPIEDVPD
jgi:hypothetical protein